MNSKSNLTKTMLILCLGALLILQPAFGQIAKPNKAMTPEQIESYLKKAQKFGWSVTIRTKDRSYSGAPQILSNKTSVAISDPHFLLLVGPCGLEKDFGSTVEINLSEITSVGLRNIPLKILQSAGEISYTAANMATVGLIAYPALGIYAAKERLKK